ncbi:MAG: helix-turn-helix transcriptional regulator [Daejeonella sp.]|nr:helix-turn-helix transcriptional regulator [Daejeonella sp.]
MKAQFGKFLQEELKEEGRPSLQDFASMLGISYRTLFNIFSGKTEFTLQQAIRASTILQTDLIGKFRKTYGDEAGAFLEPYESYAESKPSKALTVSVNVRAGLENMDNLTEFLRRINKEAIALGLIVM